MNYGDKNETRAPAEVEFESKFRRYFLGIGKFDS
jgi:hypothetical protein